MSFLVTVSEDLSSDTFYVTAKTLGSLITVLSTRKVTGFCDVAFTSSWDECPSAGGSVTSDYFDFPIPVYNNMWSGTVNVQIELTQDDVMVGCFKIPVSVSANVSAYQYVQNSPAKTQMSLALVVAAVLAIAAAATYKMANRGSAKTAEEKKEPLASNEDAVAV